MFKLILLCLIFLFSLLTVFRAPTNALWYVSILVTEFSWVLFLLVIVLLLWPAGQSRYTLYALLPGIGALVLLSLPVIDAYRISGRLKNLFPPHEATAEEPFRIRQLFTRAAPERAFTTLTYDTAHALTLDFYKSALAGQRPCVVVVHGGSWAGGDSRQLPELNSVLASKGYHVASINYRLAPKFFYPAPVQDVKSAIRFLNAAAASLSIDTGNYVLLGRSAGAQVALSAAYTLGDANIKGVIDFYGPADMVWGYANPTSPLVMDSRKIMSDYLGGTYEQVPGQYTSSSATETLSAGTVPTLMIYGKNDPLVSPLHGVRLAKIMDSLGVKHYDLYLPWATHAFDWTLNGPGGQLSTWAVMRFLKTVTGAASH